jgi:hypothetical protein
MRIDMTSSAHRGQSIVISGALIKEQEAGK